MLNPQREKEALGERERERVRERVGGREGRMKEGRKGENH
jgi:hypothetical protein